MGMLLYMEELKRNAKAKAEEKAEKPSPAVAEEKKEEPVKKAGRTARRQASK